MIEPDDAGHVETQKQLPEPLASMGFLDVGNVALPSAMLSLASALVFAIVFGFLRLGGPRHELFVLPAPDALVIGTIAALLSWLIALRCKQRPGRVGPRIWALMLALMNSAIAVLCPILSDQSLALALAVSGLAAALTLTPRLIRLRPSSALIQFIAPLSVGLILVVILPSSCAARQAIVRKTEDRVDQRIRQLRLWAADLDEVTSFDWRSLERNSDAAGSMVGKLRSLNFSGGPDDAMIWHSAAVLGRDGDLVAATQALMDRVVAGLAPDRVPRVSDLKQPAIHWDPDPTARKWQAYEQFPRLSEITGSYHYELGRLFAELENAPAEGDRQVEYRRHWMGQRGVLQTYLKESVTSFPDHWAVFRVPRHAELVGRDHESLDELLRTPFIFGEEALAPADLARLTRTPLQQLRSLAGCGGNESRQAPGCRCQNYDERDHEYFRLDCYSYAPRREGTGADLRIEMRVVYGSPRGPAYLGNHSLPSELYFHFLLPEGKEEDAFRADVMRELAGVVGGDVRSTDRGGSVTGGFSFSSNGEWITVWRPEMVVLTGPTPAPKALKVRVERTQDRTRS